MHIMTIDGHFPLLVLPESLSIFLCTSFARLDYIVAPFEETLSLDKFDDLIAVQKRCPPQDGAVAAWLLHAHDHMFCTRLRISLAIFGRKFSLGINLPVRGTLTFSPGLVSDGSLD